MPKPPSVCRATISKSLGRILTDRVSGEPAAKPETTTPAPSALPRQRASSISTPKRWCSTGCRSRSWCSATSRCCSPIVHSPTCLATRASRACAAPASPRSFRATRIPAPARSTVWFAATARRCSVTARLQSVSWQGRAALMLSASPAEAIRGHEGAVRAFAEIAAEAREEGFILADRAGTITHLSGHGTRTARPNGAGADRQAAGDPGQQERHGAAAAVPRKAGALRRDGPPQPRRNHRGRRHRHHAVRRRPGRRSQRLFRLPAQTLPHRAACCDCSASRRGGR